MEKHCFLTLFAESRSRSSKNFVFFLHTKFLEKREKTLFSHTFWRTSHDKLKKRYFFRFISANFVQSVSQNVKKHCFQLFTHFLQNIVQKAQKRNFFAYFANFVQSVSKNVKKHSFLTLFAERRA